MTTKDILNEWIANEKGVGYIMKTRENILTEFAEYYHKKQLRLHGVVVPRNEGTLCDETESNRQNSSIATYTEDSKPENYA